jgi:hypothetical protein
METKKWFSCCVTSAGRDAGVKNAESSLAEDRNSMPSRDEQMAAT